jgi:catechol 2,3-dioxygenase-like lactoylglutathione lyase family enzyme
MRRLFDHLDLRVRSLQAADAFYSEILPLIGFPNRVVESEKVISFDASDQHEKPRFIALIEEADYVPSSTRVAFWAEQRSELDRVAEALRRIDAAGLEGPMICPEYSPSYYAVFFEDPSGNRLELCCRS